MRLGFTRCQALLVVIAEEFVQEIKCFIRCVSLVLWCDEPCPEFSGISGGPSHQEVYSKLDIRSRSPSQDFVILSIESYIILVDVCV